MLTIKNLIDRQQRTLEAAKDNQARALDHAKSLRAKVEANQDIPEHRVNQALRELDKATREADYAQKEMDDLIAEQAEDERVAALQRQIYPTGVKRSIPHAQTLSVNHRDVYSREAALTGERSFLIDLFRSQVLRDPQASQRLAEHGATVAPPMQRDITTGNVAGFTPPQYLVELFAEYARAGRPVANLATPLPLPATGMKVVIPRLTTPTQVGVQAAEGDAVTEGNPDDTLLEPPVVTVAGYVDLSRQAIERGELTEMVVLGDLAAAYNTALDAQCLTGSGSSGQHLGIRNTAGVNTVTYTDASPTLPELFPKLAAAAGLVVSGRFTGPSHIVMHPTTWAWIVAQLDTTNRPLVVPDGNGAANSIGTAGAPVYGGFSGHLIGLPVALDANVPTNLGAGTNQTEIYVMAASDLMLWEDQSAAPEQLRFDDAGSGNLLVRLLAYGYSAFTAGRQPKAVSIISGTGLATLTP